MEIDDLIRSKFDSSWMKPPAWRWQEAMAANIGPEYDFLAEALDDFVHRAATFYRACRMTGPGKAFLQTINGGRVYTAHRLYGQTAWRGGARWQIEAMLVAGASNDQLQDWLPVPSGPETYEYYRRIFFDIDDYRDKPGCVLAAILATGYPANHEFGDCDLTWKMLAYEFGVERFQSFLKHYIGGRLDPDIRQFLTDFNKDRLTYYNHHFVKDLRLLFQDQALDLLRRASVQASQERGGGSGTADGPALHSDMEIAVSAVLGAAEYVMMDSDKPLSAIEFLQDPELNRFIGGSA